ncbi:MAG: dethiobiotin synthase [Synechococcaceae bacterium WB8_1A_041]|nr:dethiobiotin synthase [Synechococcaceae bacterium WB6_3A_227]NBQ19287.1 dethiobiotin synthase [Synechococcaceae bacterium WB5_2A_257]NBR44232.1 dethiobiotin synthase [Synechococcaceae bacterium WB5_2B_268]NBY58682.1 dethiobiotin synthase [Synechococcaceae bacterium LLD_019]NCU77315.1 dethiobiotin synthase [Synechococcaceae bacterium WB7_1C_051]NCU91652.1 dethiobiotin synthase [Synechococcaceae bacterium WB7_1B_046]NCY14042.1 dethiobiotin synthase [Synechococcaceae bacterium WB8_1A_041]
MKTPNRLIVAGTDTNVGKTIVSSLLVAKLNAYYWKPIQCGELDTGGDSATIKKLTGIKENRIIPEAYRLKMAASPNQAAEAEGITIEDQKLKLPSYGGALVVELAGGLMVPLRDNWLQIDQIKIWNLPVVLVARSGLGTLNHTLLSLEAMEIRNIQVTTLILNGEKHEGNYKTLNKIVGAKLNIEELFEKIEFKKY